MGNAVAVGAEGDDDVASNLRQHLMVALTNTFLPLNVHFVALLPRVFGGPIFRAAVQDQDLINPLAFHLRHDDRMPSISFRAGMRSVVVAMSLA